MTLEQIALQIYCALVIRHGDGPGDTRALMEKAIALAKEFKKLTIATRENDE